MRTRKPTLTIASLAAGAWCLAGTFGQAAADPLAEYYFWDSVGRALGNAASSYQSYVAQRQMWSQNIDRARERLAACGDCPQRGEIEQELAYWQNVESDFEHVAGSILQSMGYPPAVSQALGIPPFGFSRRHEGDGARVEPEWVKSAPEQCQAAARQYLACSESTKMRSSSPERGHVCYDGFVLFEYCREENYVGFARAAKVQELRREGFVIPEVRRSEHAWEIYYGEVEDDFVPPTPPRDDLLEEISKRSYIEVEMVKTGSGFLDRIVFDRFGNNVIETPFNCLVSGAALSPREERICEDIDRANYDQSNPVIRCYYTQGGGTRNRTKIQAVYWLESRPELADPGRLKSRDPAHPMLAVGDPRSACPPTLEEVRSIDAARIANLAAMPQDSGRSASEPAGSKDRVASIEGVYEVNGTNQRGQTYSGTCTIRAMGADRYLFRWEVHSPYSGTGVRMGDTIKLVSGSIAPATFTLNPDGSLSGTWANGRASETLRPRGAPQIRVRPSPPERLSPRGALRASTQVAALAGDACSVDRLAGNYLASWGPIRCDPAGSRLECCYGDRCAWTLRLALSDDAQSLGGEWDHNDGSTGPVRFSVTNACALGSGRYGYAPGKLAHAWRVRGRLME